MTQCIAEARQRKQRKSRPDKEANVELGPRARRVALSFDAGAIEISDGTITTAPLALPIMLALAMVKAQATIPGTSGQGY